VKAKENKTKSDNESEDEESLIKWKGP